MPCYFQYMYNRSINLKATLYINDAYRQKNLQLNILVPYIGLKGFCNTVAIL